MTLAEYVKNLLEQHGGMQKLVSMTQDEMTGEHHMSMSLDRVPEGMKLPYVCIREESDVVTDEKHVSDVLLSFDIFAENDYTTVKRISRLIQELFDGTTDLPYYTSSVAIGEYPIPTQDVSLNARNVRILYREARPELTYEEETIWALKCLEVYVKIRINT